MNAKKIHVQKMLLVITSPKVVVTAASAQEVIRETDTRLAMSLLSIVVTQNKTAVSEVELFFSAVSHHSRTNQFATSSVHLRSIQTFQITRSNVTVYPMVVAVLGIKRVSNAPKRHTQSYNQQNLQ
jgi:hypothetical protein